MYFKKLSKISKNIKGFSFDWHYLVEHTIVIGQYDKNILTGIISMIPKFNYITIQDLEVNKTERHHNYGSSLVAFAIWYSFRSHNDGYVNLLSKTNGVEKFYKKLGGIFITDQLCIFHPPVSQELVDKYLPKGDFYHE